MVNPRTAPPSTPAPHPGLWVVGIGASAGGLAALQAFLRAVPVASGWACVVVQHLDPTHKALLAVLLQRVTAMTVEEAVDGAVMQADRVYVIPPDRELVVKGRTLALLPPSEPRGLRRPIDRLFESLAAEYGHQAIGVVLSGMGADGTRGVEAIRAAGGLTLAQAPASAQYPAMPASALDSGCIDIQASADELPTRLMQAITAAAPPAPVAAGGPQPAEGVAPQDDDASLLALLHLLSERTGHDLSDYKPSTVRRRIERRLAAHGLDNLQTYGRFARDNPAELDILFKELLIGVTRFFRDPEAWEELRGQVLPVLVDRARPGLPLRAWVVGCSTGEEAYTLAMVYAEFLSARGLDAGSAPRLQIFASDLSPEAIAIARRGRYGPQVAAEVGPERLQRFFRHQGGDWLVDKRIRDMVLFAQHDVIIDPPFTQLDLLSCRNLLIYFKAGLQRRLLPLFGYCLRPGGALLLGGSETVGNAQSIFQPVNPKSRLYWRSDDAVAVGDVDFPVRPKNTVRTTPKDSSVPSHTPSPAGLQLIAEQTLLQVFAPAAVLVNEQGDVLYVHGRVGTYLEPAAGRANWNIHAMARPRLRSHIAVALREAVRTAKAVDVPDLRLDDGGEQPGVSITIAPVVGPSAEAPGTPGVLMVAFRPVPAPSARLLTAHASSDALPGALGEELERCKAEIQALRLEMTASAEELQAANEALQSINEELQSANEELTTSKEESQSMNEELQTLNQELQAKLDDLALAHSDMQNLLNSTDIATLFLDNELHVRRFTEQITRLIHLRESDIGRPLSDLASTLKYPELTADARQTLRTLTFTEKEITTTDGQWYMVRIKPYRTLSDQIQGVVITFIDITAAKVLESKLRQT